MDRPRDHPGPGGGRRHLWLPVSIGVLVSLLCGWIWRVPGLSIANADLGILARSLGEPWSDQRHRW